MNLQLSLALSEPKVGTTDATHCTRSSAPKGQLLKWIGNKQRFAGAIISKFPRRYRTYFEPFLGSAAVLAAMAPESAEGSDIFDPLINIWENVQRQPIEVKRWYRDRFALSETMGKEAAYLYIRDRYNAFLNPADLLYLSRSCYGGVVRFRLKDGYMSTPCGPHALMPPASFDSRVDDWHKRIGRTRFFRRSFEEALDRAGEGDIVYCDPPYSHSQAILYGAQRFSLERLFSAVEVAKRRGAFVAVSIDGSKKSGNQLCDIPIPTSLFAREEMLMTGRSMLRRFQMSGETLETEIVRDRLLLTH